MTGPVRAAAFAALSVALLPGALSAQVTKADCTALGDAADAALAVRIVADVAVAGPTCIYSDLEVSGTGARDVVFAADRLDLTLDAPRALLDTRQPPRTVTLHIENLRPVPVIDDPVFAYVFAAQARANGTDVDLVARWDAATNRILIETLRFDLPGLNHIVLVAEIGGADLSTFGTLQTSVGGMGLIRLEGAIGLHGAFEAYVLPALLPTLVPFDADPGPAVVALLGRLVAQVETAPDAILPAATKATLAAVLAEMPNPSGRLEVSLDASPGLGAQRFARWAILGLPDTPDRFWQTFDGVRLTLDYLPSEAE